MFILEIVWQLYFDGSLIVRRTKNACFLPLQTTMLMLSLNVVGKHLWPNITAPLFRNKIQRGIWQSTSTIFKSLSDIVLFVVFSKVKPNSAITVSARQYLILVPLVSSMHKEDTCVTPSLYYYGRLPTTYLRIYFSLYFASSSNTPVIIPSHFLVAVIYVRAERKTSRTL